tara:strand:- start:150 stop:353 length:204 start_codon:yes stop_codon:yes gene_type:complete
MFFGEDFVRATNTTWSCAQEKDLVGVSSVIKVVGGNHDSFFAGGFFFDCIQDQGTRNDVESINWFVE